MTSIKITEIQTEQSTEKRENNQGKARKKDNVKIIKLSIRMTPEQHKALDVYAKSEGRNMSNMILTLIREGIKQRGHFFPD